MPRSALAAVTVVAALTVLVYACGGGGDDSPSVDIGSVPTATLPASLPDPLIVGESDVPRNGANDTTYVVQDGDTLADIAEQFGTTVEAIVQANGLSGTELSVGQELIIPGVPDESVTGPPATPAATTPQPPAAPTDTPEPAVEDPVDPAPDGDCPGHVVQEGEFPDNIAPLYGLTTEELMAANPGIDPTSLNIGDCLFLP